MKKIIAILFSILVCALISMSAISTTQAYIEEWTWLPPYIQKASGVVIYEDGSTVELKVPVYNNVYSKGLNVSKVIIGFDWGENKTLDLSASINQVTYGTTEVFTVSFTADATEAVSSDWAHTYTVYVEHAYGNGTRRTADTWSYPWSVWTVDYKFVVYSTDQADASDLANEYSSYATNYPSTYFASVNASQLRGQAAIEAALGSTYYTRGEYDSAKTQYQTALDLYGQALAAEKEYEMQWEEALLNVAKANVTIANARMKEADAAINQSYAWMFFGIGFIFMGIATIIYAAKKPKAA